MEWAGVLSSVRSPRLDRRREPSARCRRSGTQTVYAAGAAGFVFAAQLGPDALIVTTAGVGSPRVTTFAYERASGMSSMLALAGRVGMFPPYGARLSDAGRDLVNAAIDWLIGQTPPPPQPVEDRVVVGRLRRRSCAGTEG
ncbi:MAG: hypothetical protein R2705_08555 [Ilumatobacteraceae bacterium]